MSSVSVLPYSPWEYRDLSQPLVLHASETEEEVPTAPVPELFTEEQVLERVRVALSEADAIARAREAAAQRRHHDALQQGLHSLEEDRHRYFRAVEAEIVQLSLGIARKVLQREAEVDPTLLQALVRIALDRIAATDTVRVRLHPADLTLWPPQAGYEVSADATLQPGEITVETDLGVAHVGIEAQLKEVERSFSDLLSKRPGSR